MRTKPQTKPKKRTTRTKKSSTASYPNLGWVNRLKTNNFLVGLTGKNASGKGEAARILQEHGYAYRSLSDVLRLDAAKRGVEPSREHLIRLGKELRESGGPGVLAKLTLERIEAKENYVIDSIRNPVEIELLRAHGNFLLLAVDAPIEVRFQRALKRGRNENALTLEEFRHIEEQEHSSRNPAQQLDLCLEMADEIVDNSQKLDSLTKEIETVVKNRHFPWK
jgi:dephospho-CoA kinase